MKKKILGLLITVFASGLIFSGFTDVVSAETSTTNNANSQIQPRMWAWQTVKVKVVYYGRDAYVPSTIYYSQGTQAGTLSLGNHSYNSNTGRWTCYYTGVISGNI